MGLILIQNSLKNLFQRPIQTLSLIFFIMASTFIYVTLEGATSSVNYFLADYNEATNQEDFFVVLSVPTERDIRTMFLQRHQSVALQEPNSERSQLQQSNYSITDYYFDLVDQLATEFNATIDGRFYYDRVETVHDQAHTFRFVKETDSVNQTYVLEGRLPAANHEMALFREYAKQNQLHIGDTMTIGEQDYTITAFVALPDYIYPIFSFDSPLFNPQTQTIVMTTDEAYAQFVNREMVLFSGYFHDEVDISERVNELSDFPGVSYVMDNQMNIRISTLDFQILSNQLLSFTFSNLLLLMCAAVVLLMMKKRLNAEKVQIGILKAMGYSQFSIMSSYLVLPLVAATIGSAIGFFMGLGCAKLLANTYVIHFVLPTIPFSFTPWLIVRGVLFPILVTSGVGFASLQALLKGEPISLMQENNHLKLSKVSKGLSRLLRAFPFQTRFKYSLAFRNLGKILSLFTVVLIASMFLVFGFIAFNAVGEVSNRAFSRANYRYEVKYNQLINRPLVGAETEFLKLQAYPDLEVVHMPFYLYGIDPENEINPLYNGLDEAITPLAAEGLLINEFIARAYSLEVGDQLTFQVRGSPFTYQISGIVDHYNGPMMYTSLDRLRQDLNVDADAFNGSWTSERPATNQNISYVFSMEELFQNVTEGMEMIRISLQIMVIMAVLIGSFMLIVITNFVIDENQKQISILKVMGYNEREVSQMVLTIYLPFVTLAYGLGVLITRAGVDLIMKYIANRLPLAIPTDFTVTATLMGALLVLLTYYIAVKCSKRQLDQVSLQEVLKY